jgi:TRAP-type C4-dicarboxylate transport system permease small subunit
MADVTLRHFAIKMVFKKVSEKRRTVLEIIIKVLSAFYTSLNILGNPKGRF